MKYFILILIVCAGLATPLTAQWTDVTPHPDSSFVHLLVATGDDDDLRALVVDYYEQRWIYSSPDGGSNWTKVLLPVWLQKGSVLIADFQWSDPQTGYLAGHRQSGVQGYGFLARTTDGGATWTDVTPTELSTCPCFNGRVVFRLADAAHALLLFSQGPPDYSVLTTADTGQTWQSNPAVPVLPLDIRLRPDGQGVMLAYLYNDSPNDGVLVTADFGRHWSAAVQVESDPAWPLHRQGLYYRNHFFHDFNLGFRDSTFNVQDFVTQTIVEKTTDGGVTWTLEPITMFNNFVNDYKENNGRIWMTTGQNVFRWEGTIAVKTPLNTALSLRLFPVPAAPDRSVQLKLGQDFSGPVRLTLSAADGSVVQRETLAFAQGEAAFAFPTLPAGAYFVTITAQNGAWRATAPLILP